MSDLDALKRDLSNCRLCAERFRLTATAHTPNPVVWFNTDARILIAGQAPGLRVHEANRPFWDRSGDRLRDWLGIDSDTFYDRTKIAIVPMAFCFPGYNAAGSDLPPPRVCAETWRARIMDALGSVQLTLLIGGYAQTWHLGERANGGVTSTVANWQSFEQGILPLPHPSWRNTAWLRRNPWFETDLLPVLKRRVREALA